MLLPKSLASSCTLQRVSGERVVVLQTSSVYFRDNVVPHKHDESKYEDKFNSMHAQILGATL